VTYSRRKQLTRERGEAVALFCYQAKKWTGAVAAALGGLDGPSQYRNRSAAQCEDPDADFARCGSR
jgi:hypothetical protein